VVNKFCQAQILVPVASVLNDRFMGMLGILAFATSVYPVLFDVSDDSADVLEWFEWGVVLTFALEYLVHLTLAEDKRAYVLNGWRLLDLGIIALCALTLLPVVAAPLRTALGLRVLRVVQAIVFSLRARSTLHRPPPSPAHLESTPVPRTFWVHWEESWKALPLAWQEFVSHAATKSEGWLDAYDVGAKHLEELANTLKIPLALFSILPSATAYPRLKVIGARLIGTLWLPLVKQGEWLEIERVSFLLSLAEHGPLLTITPTDYRLRERLTRWLPDHASPNVEARAAEACFRMVLDQNEEALAHLEVALRQLEAAQPGRIGEEFFHLAFRLRRDLAQVKADLWRLTGTLDAIKSRRMVLPRHGKTTNEAFVVLSDQADYLHETASNLAEQLSSLIDLHMNTMSLRMNRFMQLLAIVTVLTAIPAIVGGMLGMNILGNPWPVTLGQVTFGVALTVLGVSYIFLTGKYIR
jgi:Mg2+ and Co2+ transporter CorA